MEYIRKFNKKLDRMIKKQKDQRLNLKVLIQNIVILQKNIYTTIKL